MDYKIIISVVAIIFSFIAYGMYVKDILQKKTVPHSFTFFIWGLTSVITWGLQVYGGAGLGAWVTLIAAIILIFIFFLSLKYGEKNITQLDIFFLLVALGALFLWIFAKQPILSVILLVAIDAIGYGPTIRKAWKKPREESLLTWEITASRNILSVFALQSFNVLTYLSPVVCACMNICLSMIVIIRRKKLNN